jgi:hypothetical protein
VRFLSRGDGYILFLTPTEAVLALDHVQLKAGGPGAPTASPGEPPVAAPRDVVRMKLLGGSANPTVQGAQPLAGRVNYVTGIGDSQRQQEVPTYGRVQYKGVYPGIDLVYYGNDRALEYDVVIAPEADPSVINPGLFGRESLIYSTLLGGMDFEVAHSIASDAAGNAYVTGSTDSDLDFPVTPGAFQTSSGWGNCGTFERPRGCQDAFVTKLDPSGSTLLYSTYLGGLGHDVGNGIAVDEAGFVYVVGQAFAHDFPVHRAVQPKKASGCCTDGFLTKLTPGGAVRYSTYFGGTGDDAISDLAVDRWNNVFVVGGGNSADLTIVNPLQARASGGNDGFIAVIGEAEAARTIER